MTNEQTAKMTLTAGAASLVAAGAVAQANSAEVDEAFATLKTYDWGADRATLNPIDQAIIATHGDAAARQALEKRFVDALAGGLSRSAQDFVCRKLRVVGTTQSVEALAALLADEKTSHIARYALERMPGAKAIEAMRDALPKVGGKLKPGLIGSLGVRRDETSVAAIAAFLGDSDKDVARATAHALALIGTPAAADALSEFAKTAPADMKVAVADARLLCAEQLLADGAKSEALALYKELNGGDQPTQVRVAAIKGMLAASTKK